MVGTGPTDLKAQPLSSGFLARHRATIAGMPRPTRRESTTIDLELAGTVNGVAYHATGTARVAGPDRPLQVEFVAATGVLHRDPLLAALTCCEATRLAADAEATVIAQADELATESRAATTRAAGWATWPAAPSRTRLTAAFACACRSSPPTFGWRRTSA